MIQEFEIQNIISQITQKFHPLRIILFGSYAWGQPNSDSDVDLLIILPYKDNEKSWKIAAEIRKHISAKFPPKFPIDIMVRTPQHFEERLEIGDVFFRVVNQKGKILYEAARS